LSFDAWVYHPHLAGELLASSVRITLNHIPYRREAPTLVDLIGKQVPVMFANITTAMPQINSGSVRGVAVTSLHRTPVAPSIPTMAEAGLPGFEVQNWYGIMAPAGTPQPIIGRIHAAVEKILLQPEVQKDFSNQGLTTEPMSSREFGNDIESEIRKWSKVVKNVGIKLN
jgi:tripartite-type tricarboxylate transporter receptor subunit TctC